MAVAPDQRRERQQIIRELLAAQEIHNQTELADALKARGLEVTQSSVSRDLAELHAVKAAGRYVLAETLAAAPDAPNGTLSAAFHEAAAFITGISVAGAHILVVQTKPGGASPVGRVIDEARWPEVVGTVAGDDTLFIATAGRRQQARVEARLQEIRGG